MNYLSKNPRPVWQVSLRRLLVVVALSGGALGLIGRQVLLRDRYASYPGEVVDVQSLWKAKIGQKLELTNMVVYPKGIRGHSMTAGLLGSTPYPKGVSLLPEGVFLDGMRVERDCRVFVMSSERQLIPIKLSPPELKSLTPETAEDISQTAAWAKIKDIYEAEEKAMLKNSKLPQWKN